MKAINEIKVEFPALPENEKLSRLVISAFAAQLNPTVEELEDIKTAVSEAVTNAIVHGYDEEPHTVFLAAQITRDKALLIQVRDNGIGIADVQRAMEPFYTTKPDEERSGMGFTVMASFMDEMSVTSHPGMGTTVYLKKKIASQVPKENSMIQ